jgi:hypothetical protein
MTHRSKHSESYKSTEADTPLAHASDESISYDQNQFFAQVPRVLAPPLHRNIKLSLILFVLFFSVDSTRWMTECARTHFCRWTRAQLRGNTVLVCLSGIFKPRVSTERKSKSNFYTMPTCFYKYSNSWNNAIVTFVNTWTLGENA